MGYTNGYIWNYKTDIGVIERWAVSPWFSIYPFHGQMTIFNDVK